MLQLHYSKALATRWANFQHAFSSLKCGVTIGSLNPTQLAALKVLMASVLSQGTTCEDYDELEVFFQKMTFLEKQPERLKPVSIMLLLMRC